MQRWKINVLTFANAECKSRSSQSCHSVKREEQANEGEEGNSDGECNEEIDGPEVAEINEVGTVRDDDVAEEEEEGVDWDTHWIGGAADDSAFSSFSTQRLDLSWKTASVSALDVMTNSADEWVVAIVGSCAVSGWVRCVGGGIFWMDWGFGVDVVEEGREVGLEEEW